MAVTIKDIAIKAGVSRGTVDRVLHNRSGVKPEVCELVNRIASEQGFSPNRAGKNLAACKNPLTIGYVYPGAGNSFFGDVVLGFKAAAEVYAHYGVSFVLRELSGFNGAEHITSMRQLMEESSCQALCVTTVDVPEMQNFINEIVEEGMTVVTVNTDLTNTNRLCYVGSDYKRAGETAGGLLSMIAKTDINLLIVTGSVSVKGHNDRIQGFLSSLDESKINYNLTEVLESLDNDLEAYEKTKTSLVKNPEINCIYIAAAGVSGVCRAVCELALEDSIHILTHDETPETSQLIKDGVIDFTICQEPYRQGYHTVELLFEYFIEKKQKAPDDLITNTIIKIRSNL